jgi:hypothetical protein
MRFGRRVEDRGATGDTGLRGRFATRVRLGVGRCRCDGDRQRGITNLFPLPLTYGMNRMDGMESVTRSMYRGSVGLTFTLG